MKSPLVSIVVPVFNADAYIHKCIISILNQTYANLEVIIINDGSTDASLSILLDISKKDERVIIINQSNAGVSAARNRGIDKCSGDYIGFVDSDDFVAPEMYAALMDGIQRHNADISECGYATVNALGEIVSERPLNSGVSFGKDVCCREYLMNDNCTNFSWNKLYSSKLFSNVRYPILRYSEDYVVNVSVFSKCERKVTVAGCYYFYFIDNVTSVTKKPFSQEKFDIVLAGKLAHDYILKEFPEMTHLAASYILDYCIYLFEKHPKSRDMESTANRRMLIDTYREFYSIKHRLKDFRYLGYRLEIGRLLFRLSPLMYSMLRKMPGVIVHRY